MQHVRLMIATQHKNIATHNNKRSLIFEAPCMERGGRRRLRARQEDLMNLVLLVCLATSPGTCREERLLVGYDLVDARACMMGSAPIIAEWTEAHPEWQVSRWSCGGADRERRVSRNFN